MKQTSESYEQLEPLRQRALLRRLVRKIKNKRDQVIFSLLLETGSSPEELVQLKPADFEFTTCSLNLGTGADRRKAKLPLELSLLLNSFIDRNSGYLFESRQSGQVTARRVIQLVEEYTAEWFGQPLTVGKVRDQATSRGKAKQAAAAKRKLKQVVSDDDIAKIRSKISDEQHQLMFDILAETGCRAGELARMTVGDSGRFSAGLQERVKNYSSKRSLAQNSYLFSTRQSQHYSDKRIFQLVKHYAQLAGVRHVSPQAIRNARIADALRNGATPSQLKEQFGVESVKMEQYSTKKKPRRDFR